MTKTVNTAAPKTAAAKAELAAFQTGLRAIGDAMLAAHESSASAIRTLVLETASKPSFAAFTLAAYKGAIEPIVAAELARMPISNASRSVYKTGCRTLFLAKAHKLAIGKTVNLSRTGNLVDGLKAKGVLAETGKGATAKAASSAAVPAGKRTARQQVAVQAAEAKAKASTGKVVTLSGLTETLRLVGYGDRSDCLAALLLNEKPVVIRWIDTVAS